MRVPENVLKGIAYIGQVAGTHESGIAYGDYDGTGFFVQVVSEKFPELRFPYAVTAKHVVEKKDDSKTFIVVNNREGKTTQLRNIGEQWWFHPTDKTADVAVRQVGFQNDVDLLAVAAKHLISTPDIGAGSVVPGDEVFMAGWFSLSSDGDSNLPIIRHGNIAMLPKNQIQTPYGYADVHLIEARSIGGLSGSPAFVRPPLRYGIEMPKGTTAYFDAIGEFRLLGVVHGHWDINEKDLNSSTIKPVQEHGVNIGIGIVVPAAKILETINRPELVELRRRGEESLAMTRSVLPKMDTVKRPKKEGHVQPITQQDFEDALRKATRKVDN